MDNELEQRVAALEEWKAQKTAQQIAFPLDFQSQAILNKYFLSKVGDLNFTRADGTVLRSILIEQDNKTYAVTISNSLIIFTAQPANDTITLATDVTTGMPGQINDGATFFVESTDTLPSPLVDTTEYTAYNSTGSILQLLAPTSGNFTLSGSVSMGVVSAFLVSAWTDPSGVYSTSFDNGDIRDVTYTNGTGHITWSPGLSSGAGTTITIPSYLAIVDITDTGSGTQYALP